MGITLHAPKLLWICAAALPIVLCVWLWLWRRTVAARKAFAPETHRAYDRTSSWMRACLLAACDAALMGMLILGMARPERTITVLEPVYTRALTVVAFDTSSSTKAEAGYFGEGGRLGAEKRAFQTLLDAAEPFPDARGFMQRMLRRTVPSDRKRLMEGQRIAVVRFAGLAITTQEPTARHESVREVIRLLEPVADPNDDGTNFVGALAESSLIFSSDARANVRVLILLTDGEKDDGNSQPVDAVLQELTALGIKIFSIVVGHERARVPGTDQFTQPDTEFPQYLAEMTGGKMFAFDDREKLYGILAEIFGTVRDAVTQPVEKRENLQPWCAIAALAVFGIRSAVQYLV